MDGEQLLATHVGGYGVSGLEISEKGLLE